jgi:hypothetical protein
MKVDKHSLSELAPVVESAREVLADMDDDDVPAGLRVVARSSARQLPPPFARSVVQELFSSESFRTEVATSYAARATTDTDLVQFLEDPEVGIVRIVERSRSSQELDAQTGIAEANHRVSELSKQLVEAKRRVAVLRTTHVRELEAARLSAAQGQVRAEDRIRKLSADLSVAQDEIAKLVREVDRLSGVLSSTESKFDAAVAKGRRRDEAGAASPHESRVDATPSDPLELARWLDTVEHNIRPFRVSRRSPASFRNMDPLEIDPGIAPDSAEAVVSLIGQVPDRFILDGYNISGEMYADNFATRLARDDVIGRAGLLARSSAAEVTVVFDGPEEEGRPGFRSSSGVVVVFSRGDTADDVIAALVASQPERTVVVTNDRDLRSRCTVPGCIPIWSTAFVEWNR